MNEEKLYSLRKLLIALSFGAPWVVGLWGFWTAGLFLIMPFQANAEEYCITALPHFVPKITFADGLKVIPTIGPRGWYMNKSGNPIFVEGNFWVEDQQNKEERKDFVLLPKKSPQLSPAYQLEYYSSFEDGLLAIGESGDGLYIRGSYNDKHEWTTRLYEIGHDNPPKPVSSAVLKSLESPEKVFWSNLLQSFVISSRSERGDGTSSYSVSLYSNKNIAPLGDVAVQSVVDLPNLAATALMSGETLFFAHANKHFYPVVNLRPGDDGGHFEDVYELENNWLYITGTEYKHVIHLRQNAKMQWESDRIIRIKQDEGIFERLMRLVVDMEGEQNKRDHLETIIRGQAVYSGALKRLFFLHSMQEFKDGALVPITSDKDSFETYIGDIPRLHTAFFKARNGQLYSYDGTNLKPVVNGKFPPVLISERVELGLLTDIPKFGRTFYAIRSGIYELVKTPEHFELKRIAISDDNNELLFTRFIPMREDIAILTRGNIFLLSTLKSIYSTAVPGKQINTTGSDQLPAFIPQWNGVLFTTGGSYVSKDKTEYYHLLSDCSHKP
jgi:hypothetical protein